MCKDVLVLHIHKAHMILRVQLSGWPVVALLATLGGYVNACEARECAYPHTRTASQAGQQGERKKKSQWRSTSFRAKLSALVKVCAPSPHASTSKAAVQGAAHARTHVRCGVAEEPTGSAAVGQQGVCRVWGAEGTAEGWES